MPCFLPAGETIFDNHLTSFFPHHITIFLFATNYCFMQPKGSPQRPVGWQKVADTPQAPENQRRNPVGGRHGICHDRAQATFAGSHALGATLQGTPSLPAAPDGPGTAGNTTYLFLVFFSAKALGGGRFHLYRTVSGCPPTQSLWLIFSHFLLTGLPPPSRRHH